MVEVDPVTATLPGGTTSSAVSNDTTAENDPTLPTDDKWEGTRKSKAALLSVIEVSEVQHDSEEAVANAREASEESNRPPKMRESKVTLLEAVRGNVAAIELDTVGASVERRVNKRICEADWTSDKVACTCGQWLTKPGHLPMSDEEETQTEVSCAEWDSTVTSDHPYLTLCDRIEMDRELVDGKFANTTDEGLLVSEEKKNKAEAACLSTVKASWKALDELLAGVFMARFVSDDHIEQTPLV